MCTLQQGHAVFNPLPLAKHQNLDVIPRFQHTAEAAQTKISIGLVVLWDSESIEIMGEIRHCGGLVCRRNQSKSQGSKNIRDNMLGGKKKGETLREIQAQRLEIKL